MQILVIVLPGFVVGLLVADSLRRIFSDDDKLIWKVLKDQPATMGASATTVGTLIVWVVLTALGRDPHRRPGADRLIQLRELPMPPPLQIDSRGRVVR